MNIRLSVISYCGIVAFVIKGHIHLALLVIRTKLSYVAYTMLCERGN